MLVKAFTVFMPWFIKRRILIHWFKFDLSPTSYIGLAWIFPKNLVMEEGTKIDHLTVAISLDLIHMKENSLIGRSNWITGFPTGTNSMHFRHQERATELILGESSAITKQHHIDCTSRIKIGAYASIAGYQSQLLTHSINMVENRQESAPIHIGDYTFVGTNCVLLGGSSLPSHSILAAKSLLTKEFVEEWKLFGGVPAREIRDIPRTAKYFLRKDGVVL